MIERPFLLDSTRLIARSWTGRQSTGIDRVCYAYLEHFGARAHAVVQHRGVFRVLTRRHSDMLFEMLLGSDARFRRKLMAFAPRAIASGSAEIDGDGAVYINVGHTDFDLPSHTRWVERCRLRPIYLIHDLIPITHSEFCNTHAVTRHHARVVNALRTAAGIIVNSEATARELNAFAATEGLRMPPAIGAWLAGAELQPSNAIPFGRHFVCVGTIEGRKNHFMLLQIWRRLAERLGPATPKLIIIGQKGAQASHVEGMVERCEVIRGHVAILSDCPDETLGRWIGTAVALLLPSFAEGFGLPVIEALQLGTPVIASDLPCFREIGEGIPTLLDPLDTMSWQVAITSFLENCSERRRQLDLLSDYRPPSWKDHFTKVERWLEALPQHAEFAQEWRKRIAFRDACKGKGRTMRNWADRIDGHGDRAAIERVVLPRKA